MSSWIVLFTLIKAAVALKVKNKSVDTIISVVGLLISFILLFFTSEISKFDYLFSISDKVLPYFIFSEICYLYLSLSNIKFKEKVLFSLTQLSIFFGRVEFISLSILFSYFVTSFSDRRIKYSFIIFILANFLLIIFSNFKESFSNTGILFNGVFTSIVIIYLLSVTKFISQTSVFNTALTIIISLGYLLVHSVEIMNMNENVLIPISMGLIYFSITSFAIGYWNFNIINRHRFYLF